MSKVSAGWIENGTSQSTNRELGQAAADRKRPSNWKTEQMGQLKWGGRSGAVPGRLMHVLRGCRRLTAGVKVSGMQTEDRTLS